MDRPGPDYPAAHSMDTEWYAVDRDGNVGLFDTGEAGAMPIGAHTVDETSSDDLAGLVPEPPYRLLDWLGEGTDEHHIELPTPARPVIEPRSPYLLLRLHDELPKEDGLGPALLFLRSPDPVRRGAPPYSFHEAPAAEGVAVYFPDLSAALAWKLHEGGHCLGCFGWPGESNPWAFLRDLPRRLGLFCYDHDPDAENWISGSYLRREPPSRPLRIDQLPTPIRDAIARIRFADLSFSEAESIQPIPTFPCSSWQATYLDPDGVTVRPIPGREDDNDPEEGSDVPGPRPEDADQGPTPG